MDSRKIKELKKKNRSILLLLLLKFQTGVISLGAAWSSSGTPVESPAAGQRAIVVDGGVGGLWESQL